MFIDKIRNNFCANTIWDEWSPFLYNIGRAKNRRVQTIVTIPIRINASPIIIEINDSISSSFFSAIYFAIYRIAVPPIPKSSTINEEDRDAIVLYTPYSASPNARKIYGVIINAYTEFRNIKKYEKKAPSFILCISALSVIHFAFSK